MKFQLLKAALCAAAFLLFGSLEVSAQKNKNLKEYLQASTIPDSLKEGANAVVRYASDELVVKRKDKLVIKHHSIVTILNEKADDAARLVLFYDKKFNSVNDAEMIIYNADGVQLKKYKKGDMYDRAAVDGISIVTDDRMLVAGHSIASYPATVEINYEVTRNSYFDLSEWSYLSPERAVQYAEYSVQTDPANGFRYKNYNTSIAPVKTSQDGLDKYTWTVKSLKAIKPEDDAVDWQVFPSISFANNYFSFDGIPGDFTTWKSYGNWQLGLNTDVNSLPPQRVEEIKAMTANLKTDKEKARFLYKYLQDNMRYVSIQLGIGGLKPFPATFVDQKKYGDCKALSNYMHALLKAVDIPSYYAMVRAGDNERPADKAFPSDPFNHVILCVPFKGDTTWLECTSSTRPFGKLGPFTENRNALLVTADGGVLVNTPKSSMLDNQFNTEVHITFEAEGGAKAKMKAITTGAYRDDFISMASLKSDEQKETLIRMLNMKQPNVLEISPVTDNDGVKELSLELEFDKFCDIAAGNKMFYRPRLFDLWKLTVPPLEKRKNDFYFSVPLQKACVTTIDLPQGYEVETLPVNQAFKFTYGSYDVNYKYDAAKNQVLSTATFNLNNHVIPAAKYTEMQQYMDNIAKAQNKKLVIRKKA
ncbi:DUF3857 domain-containing protein [Mucilaginibacter achroorhodeus]|uniref:DUF3857 domain-containing protein n=1 Tax=Mucilaginibacter achroorhodeus TaxID=2599294 RepID=A0A563TXY8_9SPHI|nr:DUF3857 domain-containing transglutaminase family protein [Mucilaginibacter achroorhodeus]TWR24237.1 DUF3857 domain-containing protein [Mucilaginibacter achroorhodeus]